MYKDGRQMVSLLRLDALFSLESILIFSYQFMMEGNKIPYATDKR